MRNLALVAILALAACGGGDDDDGPMFVDGGGTDTDGGSEICDPVAQSGCAAGEKCTWVTVSDEPALGKTDCVPDGTVEIGGACTQGEPGATTGFDDCAKFGLCSGGICTPICNGSPDTCGDTAVCQSYFQLFDDLGEESQVGLCNPTCNPVPQLAANGMRDPAYTDCPEGEGCYLKAIAGKASCAGVPEEAADKNQGDACYGPDAETCFLNGCAAGFQSILFTAPGMGPSVCSAFCTPQSVAVGVDGNPVGTAPSNCSLTRAGIANQECRFLQSIYNSPGEFDGSIIPAEYGICAPTEVWGSCEDYDPQGMVDAFNEAYAANSGDAAAKEAAGVGAMREFCGRDAETGTMGELLPACQDVGCLDLETAATFDAMFMGASGKANAKELRGRSQKRLRDQLAEQGGVGSPSIQ